MATRPRKTGLRRAKRVARDLGWKTTTMAGTAGELMDVGAPYRTPRTAMKRVKRYRSASSGRMRTRARTTAARYAAR